MPIDGNHAGSRLYKEVARQFRMYCERLFLPAAIERTKSHDIDKFPLENLLLGGWTDKFSNDTLRPLITWSGTMFKIQTIVALAAMVTFSGALSSVARADDMMEHHMMHHHMMHHHHHMMHGDMMMKKKMMMHHHTMHRDHMMHHEM